MIDGPRQTTNGEEYSNTEALEILLASLDVMPSVAQIAAGRTLAKLADGEPNASMMAEYLSWLETVEGALPDEPDALDEVQ